MAITRSQKSTDEPAELAGTSAGTWLLQTNSFYPIVFAVGTTAPTDRLTLSRMRIANNQQVKIAAGEKIFIWQISAPRPGQYSYFGYYGSVSYQKI